jgi:hypothetical protein
MLYGSLRFKNLISNNRNNLTLVAIERPKKVVVSKDVTLLLPNDPEKILPWEGYPTTSRIMASALVYRALPQPRRKRFRTSLSKKTACPCT